MLQILCGACGASLTGERRHRCPRSDMRSDEHLRRLLREADEPRMPTTVELSMARLRDQRDRLLAALIETHEPESHVGSPVPCPWCALIAEIRGASEPKTLATTHEKVRTGP